RAPDVAVAAALDAIAVVFTRNGQVTAVLSTDGGGTFSPAQAIDLASVPDPQSPPRIAAIVVDPARRILLLHAVWGQAGAIHYARNLTMGAWQLGPGSGVLSAAFAGYAAWSAPVVKADTR